MITLISSRMKCMQKLLLCLFALNPLILKGGAIVAFEVDVDSILVAVASHDGFDSIESDLYLDGPLCLLSMDVGTHQVVFRKGDWSIVIIDESNVECLRIDSDGLLTRLNLEIKIGIVYVKSVFRAKLEEELKIEPTGQP